MLFLSSLSDTHAGVLHHGQQYHLTCKDAQEHGERIDGRVAYGRCIVAGCLVRVGQCGGVGVATGNQTHQGEVVDFVVEATQQSDNQQRQYGNQETVAYVAQSISLHHRLYKMLAGFDAYAGQEEHDTYLSQHQVSTHSGVGDQFQLVSEAAYQDGYH